MTGNELYRSVMRLGYAESLDDLEGLFFEAANLALCRICRQFPLECCREICVSSGEPYYTPLNGASVDERFIAFCATPLYNKGSALSPGRDYLLCGGELRLPPESTGKPLLLCYVQAPIRITEDNLSQPITCRKDAEHLLPLLTASLLWAQDDDELANRYYALFSTAQTELLVARAPIHSSGYATVGGWDT